MLLNFIPAQLYLINWLKFTVKMTKRDATIGLYHAGSPYHDNKAAKHTKFRCGEEVQRAWQHQKLSRKRTLLLMSYKKQHQSRSREGKEGPQTFHDKNDSRF